MNKETISAIYFVIGVFCLIFTVVFFIVQIVEFGKIMVPAVYGMLVVGLWMLYRAFKERQ